MTRVLFLGDMQGTGFGTVTFDLGKALLAAGEDVRFVSLNEQLTMIDDLPEPFASRTLALGTPTGWLGFVTSQDEADALTAKVDSMFTTWADGWSPEVVLMVGDAGSVKQAAAVLRIPAHLPAFHYVPIEGVDLPPRWAQTWRRFEPVAMSEFGADQIAPLIGHRPAVVYHGVNLDEFWPVSAERPITLTLANELRVLRSKAECKRLFGGNGGHTWLFRADRNMPRKRYGSLFRSVAPLLAQMASLFLVYHCKTVDGGGDLEDEKSKFHPAIAAKMLSTGFHDEIGGAPRPLLNALYNAADLYLSTSAEGFGLTIAEAMACGVPAVGLHYSSVPEVIGAPEPGPGAGGYTVPVGMLVENQYSHYWAGVDESAYTETVGRLVRNPKHLAKLGLTAQAHVARTFTWQKAAEQFAGLFAAAVQQEIAA